MLASYIAVMMSNFENSDLVVEESDLQDEKDYGAIWRKHMIAAMCLYLGLHVVELATLYFLTGQLKWVVPLVSCGIYVFLWNGAIYGASLPLILLAVGSGMGLYSAFELIVSGTLGGITFGAVIFPAYLYTCWVYLFARRD